MVHPHPHQPGLFLPSWLNVRQKAAVATLCTLWSRTKNSMAFWVYHGIHSDVRLKKPAIDTAVEIFPRRIRHCCALAYAKAAAVRRCRRPRRRWFLVVFELQNLGNGAHRKSDAGPTRCDVTTSASVNIAVDARRFSEKNCAVSERQRQFVIASVVVVTNALLFVEDFVPLDFFNPDGGGELGFNCWDYQRLLAWKNERWAPKAIKRQHDNTKIR